MYISKVAALAEDYAAWHTFSGSLNSIHEVIFSFQPTSLPEAH